MSAIRITFSPTGGTQMVADHILAGWPAPMTKLDLTKGKEDLSSFM